MAGGRFVCDRRACRVTDWWNGRLGVGFSWEETTPNFELRQYENERRHPTAKLTWRHYSRSTKRIVSCTYPHNDHINSTRPPSSQRSAKGQGISVSGSLNQICCKYVQRCSRNRNSNSVNKYHHLNMPCRHRTSSTYPFTSAVVSYPKVGWDGGSVACTENRVRCRR